MTCVEREREIRVDGSSGSRALTNTRWVQPANTMVMSRATSLVPQGLGLHARDVVTVVVHSLEGIPQERRRHPPTPRGLCVWACDSPLSIRA